MQHSPSVTTATSCSAPSGVTAPAMLVKGRPVPCPGSPRLSPARPEGALPDAYCHSLGPPLGPPGLKSLLLPPAQPAWVSPSPHPPVASAPPPTPGERLAVTDGITKGPFLGHFIWLLLRPLSPLQEAGEKGGGAARLPKRSCCQGLGSSPSPVTGFLGESYA